MVSLGNYNLMLNLVVDFSCPVASALCQQLQDQCSGAGTLLSTGECSCNPGYTGRDCSLMECPRHAELGECSGGQGVCNSQTGNCECAQAFTGADCSERVCPSVKEAKNTTECSGTGTCNRQTGTCDCLEGYSGQEVINYPASPY